MITIKSNCGLLEIAFPNTEAILKVKQEYIEGPKTFVLEFKNSFYGPFKINETTYAALRAQEDVEIVFNEDNEEVTEE